MTWEEQQATVLRSRLDEELAPIRATAQARERLVRATSARTRAAENRAERAGPHWHPGLALPLAAAAAVVAIATAVAVPTLLSSGPEPIPPATGPRPPVVAVPDTASTSPEPPVTRPTPDEPRPSLEDEPAVTAKPEQAKEVTAVARSRDLTVRVTSARTSPLTGERVVLTVITVPGPDTGTADGYGEVLVDWGDRSKITVVKVRCREPSAAPTTAGHAYAEPGRFTVTVSTDECGIRAKTSLDLAVRPTSKPVDTSR